MHNGSVIIVFSFLVYHCYNIVLLVSKIDTRLNSLSRKSINNIVHNSRNPFFTYITFI